MFDDQGRIHVGEEQGRAMYFQGISYSCPSLGLYGYALDTHLRRAIRRELAKRAKKAAERDALRRTLTDD